MIETGETLLEHLRRAGIRSEGRAEYLITQMWVTVNGELIIDPDHPLSPGDCVMIGGMAKSPAG